MGQVQDSFDCHLRHMLSEIAIDHGLDSKVLLGKYIYHGMSDLSPVTKAEYKVPDHPPVIPKPRLVTGIKKKGGRKPKFSTPPTLSGELSETYLTGLTIPYLKEACKMRKIPISGGKDQLIERFLAFQKNPEAHKPAKKGGRKKKDQPPEPKHNHPLDDKTHAGCEQCKEYGNPMDPTMEEEEFEVTTIEAPVVVNNWVIKPPEGTGAPEVVEGPGEIEAVEEIDEDIHDQLRSIVSKMNEVEIDETKDTTGTAWESVYEEPDKDDEDPLQDMEFGDDDEEEEEEEVKVKETEKEDPFGSMGYGDDLEEED